MRHAVLLTDDGVAIEAVHHPAVPEVGRLVDAGAGAVYGGAHEGGGAAAGGAGGGDGAAGAAGVHGAEGVGGAAVVTPVLRGDGPVGGGDGPAGELAIVVAHGFSGALERPAVRRAAREFTRFAGVVTFSFRGHGRSGGRSTVGDREVLDLAAAVRWAYSLGYRRVATVGFSMGGTVVLRHAAMAQVAPSGAPGGAQGVPGRVEAPVVAVVSVSAPARWYYRGTAPMRRLHWVVTRPAGRLAARVGLRTRVHFRQWDPVPMSPVEATALISQPLLIVHGDRDTYFPLDHPRELADAAGDTGELWVEEGFGHAENAAEPELLRRVGAWLALRATGHGRPGDACQDPAVSPT